MTFWGGAEVYERFLAWDEPRLLVFRFEGTSEAIWRWFGERYEVEALGPDRCRLTWTVAYAPTGGFGALHPWIRPVMALNFRLYMALLRRYVRRA